MEKFCVLWCWDLSGGSKRKGHLDLLVFEMFALSLEQSHLSQGGGFAAECELWTQLLEGVVGDPLRNMK